MKTAVVFRSYLLSGAEKRLLRIGYAFDRTQPNTTDVLIPAVLHPSLLKAPEFSTFAEKPFIKSYGPSADWAKRLGDKLTKMLQFFHLVLILRAGKYAGVHASYGSLPFIRLLQKYGLYTGNILVEITSPNVVDKCLRDSLLKNWLLSGKVNHVLFVSRSTYLRFKTNCVVGDWIKLEKKASYSPIPFFNPPEVEQVPKEKVLTYASRFIKRKNPVLFAETAKRFLAARPDWRVYMLGKGELEPTIREILKAEIASGNVIVNHFPDIYQVLKKSLVFVSIIEPDNYPSQSILEAMAARNALFCNEIGQTPMFFNGQNGTLVPNLQVDLLPALLELTNDLASVEEKGIQSRTHLIENFNPSIYLNFLSQKHALLAEGSHS